MTRYFQLAGFAAIVTFAFVVLTLTGQINFLSVPVVLALAGWFYVNVIG